MKQKKPAVRGSRKKPGRRVSEKEWAPLAGSDRAFLNVNTLEEMERKADLKNSLAPT